MSAWDWKSKQPAVAGWYATALCWDAQEGMFPSAGYWNGAEWEGSHAVAAFAGPFTGKVEADAWAHEHDPEGL